LTGASTLLVGVPLLNRCVSNLIPVRIDIDDDLAPQAFVRNVHDSLLWSLDAGDVPFEQIVARLGVERSGWSHPLVQVSFDIHDQGGNGGASQFDIAVQFRRSEPSLADYVEYAASLWSRGEAQSFVMDYVAAAEQLSEATALNGTDRALADVRCISAAGRIII
jgi:non-ribosomal peptide synthetase component F